MNEQQKKTIQDAIENALGLLDNPLGKRLYRDSDQYFDTLTSLYDAYRIIVKVD